MFVRLALIRIRSLIGVACERRASRLAGHALTVRLQPDTEMGDVEAWYRGSELLAKVDDELRTSSGGVCERVAAAATLLRAAEPALFPDWFFQKLQDLLATVPTARTDEAAAKAFARALRNLDYELDIELEAKNGEGIACPRCQVRMLEGEVHVSGGRLGAVVSKALLSIRFRPDGSETQERKVAAVDAVRGYVCPICRGAFVEE